MLQSRRRNDRDAIRRRLATGNDGEFCYCSVCSSQPPPETLSSSYRGGAGDRQRRRRRRCSSSSSSSSSSGFAVELEVCCLVGDSPSASEHDRAISCVSSPAPSDADKQTVYTSINRISGLVITQVFRENI